MDAGCGVVIWWPVMIHQVLMIMFIVVSVRVRVCGIVSCVEIAERRFMRWVFFFTLLASWVTLTQFYLISVVLIHYS